jgi:hypothetical protein
VSAITVRYGWRRNRTIRRQEEGKNYVYLFVFCMNMGDINALLTISCCQMKHFGYKFGVGVKLIVILRHIIAYFSINMRWHSQNVSSDSRKWLIKHLCPPYSCKKQINKHHSYDWWIKMTRIVTLCFYLLI